MTLYLLNSISSKYQGMSLQTLPRRYWDKSAEVLHAPNDVAARTRHRVAILYKLSGTGSHWIAAFTHEWNGQEISPERATPGT